MKIGDLVEWVGDPAKKHMTEWQLVPAKPHRPGASKWDNIGEQEMRKGDRALIVDYYHSSPEKDGEHVLVGLLFRTRQHTIVITTESFFKVVEH